MVLMKHQIFVLLMVFVVVSCKKHKKHKHVEVMSNEYITDNWPLVSTMKKDDSVTGKKKATAETSRKFIPIEILEKLRKVKSLADFVKSFKPKGIHKNEDGRQSSYVRHSDGGHSADAHENEVEVTAPKELGCIPRPKLVPVPADHASIFWPSCVKLYQCSGCCLNPDHFECNPHSLVNRSTTVFRIAVDGSNDVVPQDVHMLHHATCKCQCRTRPQDCLPTQTYDPKNCQCTCTKAKQKCQYGKQWSNDRCECVCSDTRDCPKRFIWDDKNCRCRCKRSKCRYPLLLDPSTCRCLYTKG